MVNKLHASPARANSIRNSARFSETEIPTIAGLTSIPRSAHGIASSRCAVKRTATTSSFVVGVGLLATFFAPSAECRSVNIIDSTYGAGTGSFEVGAFIAHLPDAMLLPAASTTAVGWTVAGPAGVHWLKSPSYASLTGSYSMDLKGTNATFGEISTTIPTVVGETYCLSFGAYAGLIQNTGMVSVGSLVNQTFSGPVISDPATAIYSKFDFSFTAMGSITTVTFRSTSTNFFGPVIDDVSVSQPGNLIDATYGDGSGSFEVGSFVAHLPDAMLLSTGSTTAVGWTVAGPAGVHWLESPTHVSLAGTRSIDLKGTNAAYGEISTSIPTSIGETYLLSFGAYAGLILNTGTVSVGSLVNQTFSGPVVADPATAVYSKFEFSFTATGAITTLTFRSTSTNFFGPVIDDVNVSPLCAEVGVGNFLALMNGVDAVQSQPNNGGSPNTGIARLFDYKTLYAPTLVTDTFDSNFGQYSAKISAIEFGVVADPGVTTISIPLIRISSFTSDVPTLAGGAWPVAVTSTTAPFHIGIGGVDALSGAPGSTLRELKDLTFAVNGVAPCGVTTITIPLIPPVTVPVGKNALLYVADAPHPSTGPQQHFVFSNDEGNFCESFSLSLDASGLIVRNPGNEEWMAGLRLVDAVTIPICSTFGPGGKGLNAHDALGFDSGTAARTLSLSGTNPSTGTVLGSNQLGFLSYDENSDSGSAGHLVFMNLSALGAACGSVTLELPSGGPNGPVVTTSVPELPRIVCKIDQLMSNLLGNPIWVSATSHATVPEGVNVPWYPVPTLRYSGASGHTGGFMLPVPALASLVGLEFCCCSAPLNLSFTLVAKTNVSSFSMGHSFTFYP